MKKNLRIIPALLMIVLLQSCYPEGPEYIEELDIVYTDYDPSFDFKAANTFALPDEVVEINGSEFRSRNGGNEPEFVATEYREIILTRIRNNMINLGWTEVSKNDNPDVILLPSVSSTTYLYYYYDWYYWGWWYPGYYDGWGWYYPGNYYPTYTNGHRSGTLLIQMTDAKNQGVNGNVPVRWTVVINGLLEGSVSSINQRLNKTIDQAFKQSPYLQQ